jgi:predicted lipoprotein with Yx(FWY)xxD motif
MIRRLIAVAAVLISVAVLGGCGGHHSAAAHPSITKNVTLSVRSTPALGSFLVSDGWTLYMYPPDQQRHVTCTSVEGCKAAWPPLFVGTGLKVIAGPGVNQALIGTMSGDGGNVVTYNHWPLYYYLGDRKPDVVNGQDQGFNWFVIAPSGVPNKTASASPNG